MTRRQRRPLRKPRASLRARNPFVITWDDLTDAQRAIVQAGTSGTFIEIPGVTAEEIAAWMVEQCERVEPGE